MSGKKPSGDASHGSGSPGLFESSDFANGPSGQDRHVVVGVIALSRARTGRGVEA
jgi:hypothetical protein